MPEALRDERVSLMSTALSLLPLAVACLLLSLASRQWRTTALPWGIVPLFVAAAMGVGALPVTCLVIVVIVAESAGRWRVLRDVLPLEHQFQ